MRERVMPAILDTSGHAPITSRLDHFILAAPRLEAGREFLYRSVGIMPRFGGAHPGQGTCNALLGLEDGLYLEVLAPDPAQHEVPSPIRRALKAIAEPMLGWWAVRCEDLKGAASALASLGVGTSAIIPGARRTPAGDHLTWRLLFIDAPDLGGAAPFLIDWGSARPATTIQPTCGSLIGMEIFHPNASRLGEMLTAIGLSGRVEIAQRPSPSISVELFVLGGSRVRLATGHPFPPSLYNGDASAKAPPR